MQFFRNGSDAIHLAPVVAYQVGPGGSEVARSQFLDTQIGIDLHRSGHES